jgi:hypothetical protein
MAVAAFTEALSTLAANVSSFSLMLPKLRPSPASALTEIAALGGEIIAAAAEG